VFCLNEKLTKKKRDYKKKGIYNAGKTGLLYNIMLNAKFKFEGEVYNPVEIDIRGYHKYYFFSLFEGRRGGGGV
jgi:hypothetical protein